MFAVGVLEWVPTRLDADGATAELVTLATKDGVAMSIGVESE